MFAFIVLLRLFPYSQLKAHGIGRYIPGLFVCFFFLSVAQKKKAQRRHTINIFHSRQNQPKKKI